MTDPDAELIERLRRAVYEPTLCDEAANRLEELLDALHDISLIVARPITRRMPAAESIGRICRDALGTEGTDDAD